MEIIIVFSALLLGGPDTIGIFLLTLLVPPADKKKACTKGASSAVRMKAAFQMRSMKQLFRKSSMASSAFSIKSLRGKV